MDNQTIGAEGETVGCWSIRLGTDVDPAEFVEAWKSANVLSVPVGHQTRGGIVTASYLLKPEGPGAGPTYKWMIHWREQGGSPFGSANAPGDPKKHLDDFDVETTYSAYRVG